MTNKDEIKLYFQITSEIINCKDKNKKTRLRLQQWYPLSLHEKEIQELKREIDNLKSDILEDRYKW